MSSNWTQFNSIAAAAGHTASGRTCAKQFGGVFCVVAAGLCLSSHPAYLPGGELMSEGANAIGNLRISDRRSNLI
jgi:hypothetical protein